jgi:hypothetical protein
MMKNGLNCSGRMGLAAGNPNVLRR